jgi:hypothetical protein
VRGLGGGSVDDGVQVLQLVQAVPRLHSGGHGTGAGAGSAPHVRVAGDAPLAFGARQKSGLCHK